MTIQSMRLIDYWIGVPICFMLSVVCWLKRLFPLSKDREGVHEKVLLIKLSELGGIVLSYSLMRQIQKRHPGAELYFLTFDRNKDLFTVFDHTGFQNVLTINNDSWFRFARDTFRVITRLRREKISAAVDLEFFSRFTTIVSYVS